MEKVIMRKDDWDEVEVRFWENIVHPEPFVPFLAARRPDEYMESDPVAGGNPKMVPPEMGEEIKAKLVANCLENQHVRREFKSIRRTIYNPRHENGQRVGEIRRIIGGQEIFEPVVWDAPACRWRMKERMA